MNRFGTERQRHLRGVIAGVGGFVGTVLLYDALWRRAAVDAEIGIDVLPSLPGSLSTTTVSLLFGFFALIYVGTALFNWYRYQQQRTTGVP